MRIALDFGAQRIGVARCDRDGIMAVPVGIIDATSPDWMQSIAQLVVEYEPIELIIGNPVSLRGVDELASAGVRERAQALANALPGVSMRLVDERLTTATAAKQLQQAGKRAREARSMIDAQAAVGILEFALECEKRTAKPAGEAL